MNELKASPELNDMEYMPGALGEFVTPKEKSKLAMGTLGGELIELAVRRSQPFELPDDLQQLVDASHN